MGAALSGEALLRASRDGDVMTLRRCLEAGVNVDSRGPVSARRLRSIGSVTIRPFLWRTHAGCRAPAGAAAPSPFVIRRSSFTERGVYVTLFCAAR